MPSSSCKYSTPTPISKSASNPETNLIDLDDKSSVRVSILEAFDPLLTPSDYGSARTLSPECPGDDASSVCDSVYEEYDPYDFIYSNSGNNSLSDPMYAAVIKSEPQSPPPLPPRVKYSTVGKSKSKKEAEPTERVKLFDSITKINRKKTPYDADLKSFYKMVQGLRNRFRWDDPDTNMGLVVSPMMNYHYREGTSIKLTVYPHYEGADQNKPVNFTCDGKSFFFIYYFYCYIQSC